MFKGSAFVLWCVLLLSLGGCGSDDSSGSGSTGGSGGAGGSATGGSATGGTGGGGTGGGGTGGAIGGTGGATGGNGGLIVPCALPAPTVNDPYALYPALNLARVPFHAGAGTWGPQLSMEAPALPVTTRTVTVNSAAELEIEGLVPGSEVIVGTSFSEQVVLFGDVRDLDLVVPSGISVGQIIIGRYTPPSTTERVRIRGTVPMSHSGGRLGSLEFFSDPTTDVIIDGVDLNGEDLGGGKGLYHFARPTNRVAVVNVRGHSVEMGGLHGDINNLVVAGSNFFTGARPREVAGTLPGWTMRGGDRVIVFRSYVGGTRYHRVRVHPALGITQYTWLGENLFYDPNEARIASAMNIGGTPPGAMYAAIWAQCNLVYAYSTCMSPSFEGPAASFAELSHNTLYGSITQAIQTSLQASHGANHDYLTGNTFNAWEAPPPYPYPGDPRDIPLPVDDPSDDDPSLAVAPCPGP